MAAAERSSADKGSRSRVPFTSPADGTAGLKWLNNPFKGWFPFIPPVSLSFLIFLGRVLDFPRRVITLRKILMFLKNQFLVVENSRFDPPVPKSSHFHIFNESWFSPFYYMEDSLRVCGLEQTSVGLEAEHGSRYMNRARIFSSSLYGFFVWLFVVRSSSWHLAA